MSYYLLILVRTRDPRFNEPLYSEVLSTTNDIPHPIVKYHEICGKEPRYNEPRYSEHILPIAWPFDIEVSLDFVC